MSVQTTTVRTCDECRGPIAGASAAFIDASHYGADFHPSCWEAIGGPRVARVLGLDDVHYATADRYGEITRQCRAWSGG